MRGKMLVKKTELAKESRLHGSFENGDFLDCYSARIGQADAPIHKIAQRIFVDLPGWINLLLAIRDFGVTPFGLKTTAQLPRTTEPRGSIEVGDHINFFQVRSISENEIILGEDDRHLDFRISVYRDRESADQISLATWVRTHNRLGRLYLRMIAPFHVLIVNTRLAGLARRFAP